MWNSSRQDGGYGWVMTAIAFAANLILLGTFKSFGVFLLPVQESLQCSITTLGTVVAATHTTGFIFIPLMNRIAKTYGARRLAIAAGLLTFVCFVGTSTANNLPQFSVFVILWGVGVAMGYGPPIVEMLLYFPTNPALPIGIVGTGAGVGMMLCPPLAEFLIDIYGWRGAMLLFAALNANICVLGALIKPASSTYTALDGGSRESTRQSDGCTLWRCCTFILKRICEVLALDVLWFEPKFAMQALVSFLVGVMYSAWMIFLVPHAIARGINSQMASFLSTAGGVGTIVGRVLQGLLLHTGWVTALQFYTFLAFIDLVAFVLDPIISANYPGLVCVAFANGLGIPTMAVLFLQVAQQVLSKDLSVQGWGTLLVFFAFGELAGGALAGVTYEATGSYDTSFWMLGGVSGVAVVILVTERILHKCSGD
ncbi:monocarboxylate transporter 11-like [Patiria miniata]|uniref:Major facilitator superfamily (MFS) profile domain-containing protein n=1 Tax=Patiria miniata TaxID=46514 RepID=A0A913Z979_PATMI|nr:monocarboxylate transporter 11-like [Patiria miniata]